MSVPNVRKANAYARAVAGGKKVACKWIQLAAQRHLDDMRSSREDKKYPFYFDQEAAERVCKFIQMMPHTKGKWAARGELLALSDWQLFFVCCIFGWKLKSMGKRSLMILQLKNINGSMEMT